MVKTQVKIRVFFARWRGRGCRYLKRQSIPLRRYFFILKYKIIFNKKSGLNANPREIKFIVSLTSYPERFDSVFLSIESLLVQTLKPDKIILWLSQAEVKQKALPLRLTKLQSRGLEIRIVDENIKSYKKLIHALKAFGDSVIITCDDDFFYPRWFLQGLYQSYQKHPDCVSTYRCRTMTHTGEGQLMPYIKWPFSNNKQRQNQPSYLLFPTGGGGTLYPPNALNEKASNRIFMQLAPTGDDIWFKAMSLLNNTRVVMVAENSVDFPAISNSKQDTLWQRNMNDNDVQIKKVFDHFGLSLLRHSK